MVEAKGRKNTEAALLWRRNSLTRALLCWLEAVDRVQANRRAACLVLATLAECMAKGALKGYLGSWKVSGGLILTVGTLPPLPFKRPTSHASLFPPSRQDYSEERRLRREIREAALTHMGRRRVLACLSFWRWHAAR